METPPRKLLDQVRDAIHLFKAFTVKLTQTSQHGLATVARPAPTGSPQAMLDHGVSGAFHGAATDRVSLGAEVVVV